MTIAYWSPNQIAIKQVETYTFTAPSGVGNTYTATINNKAITYTSVSGDTAATVATALTALLSDADNIGPEFAEIVFTNPSSGVMVATANVAGTPFANVTVNGVTGRGLVLSTGNGLANGIATVHTTANKSPSDVSDPNNWLRVTAPAPGVRAIPVNGDDVVISDSSVPLLWNLDHLATVQFATYERWQSFTGTIGLPETNPAGYTEWRATYFKFIGPAGSVPAGGLQMVLGKGLTGSGPSRERYNVGSQKVTMTVLAAGSPQDEHGVRLLGVHTQNTLSIAGPVSVGVATTPGEISTLTSSLVDGGGVLTTGEGVTWTAASTLTVNNASVVLSSAPATLFLSAAQATILEDSLTWATITAQVGSVVTFLAGGTITTLTLENGSRLDKSQDARSLVITNSTIDGDSCLVVDPLNAITFTNATSVKQQVVSGPFQFTGTRTMKVT